MKDVIKEVIQFVVCTPEELEERIASRFEAKLDSLKRDFQPKKPEEWLTRYEVKDWFKVDLSTVHNWTKRGKLKAYGIGNRVYYKRSEVEAAIQPIAV
jgi:hypothetical protein